MSLKEQAKSGCQHAARWQDCPICSEPVFDELAALMERCPHGQDFVSECAACLLERHYAVLRTLAAVRSAAARPVKVAA